MIRRVVSVVIALSLLISMLGALSNTAVATSVLTTSTNQCPDSTSLLSTVTQTAARRLAITTTHLPAGTIEVSYCTSLIASGGITPYSWSLIRGRLPPGLSLYCDGVISGTPTSIGTFNFTVQVTDSSTPTPRTAQRALSIPINPQETSPLARRAVANAQSILEAPYEFGAKGRHWDSRRGHSAGEARWANSIEISTRPGYRWWCNAANALVFRPGIDCSGLIMWTYNFNRTGRYDDPRNPVLKEGARHQWNDRTRMEQRYNFRGNDAVTRFLNKYRADSDFFGLMPGDTIYFLEPTRLPFGHVVMYIGDGQIIHACGALDRVREESLINALTRYRGGFRLVGLGRVRVR